MQLNFSESIDIKINKASEILGLRKKDLIERAILFYLNEIKQSIQLKQEFNEWDRLSDESLINFENSL
jgi:hypothetical protein